MLSECSPQTITKPMRMLHLAITAMPEIPVKVLRECSGAISHIHARLERSIAGRRRTAKEHGG